MGYYPTSCPVCGAGCNGPESHRCSEAKLAKIDAENDAAGDAELDPTADLCVENERTEADRIEDGFAMLNRD